jgi:PAS domain S-box-containing protein
MPPTLRILHLEENPADAALVQALLAEEGLPGEVRLAADRAAFVAALAEGSFDLVLADHVTAGCAALTALALVRERDPDLPFIVVSGTPGEEAAVAALKGGATDYVLKGRLARLAPAVREALRQAQERREVRWAEEGMRGSEEKYRSLVDHLSIGISLISPEMEILSLNRQMREWFPGLDLSKRLVCYQTFNDPPGEAVCAFCPVARTFRDGEVHEAVTETPRRGEIRHYQIVASPVKNSAGQVVAVIEMVKDITARQRAEEELRHSNELMRALIAASPLAIVMLDPAGAVTMWNAAAERIFGWSEAEALGRPAPFVPAAKRGEFDRLRARVLGGEVLTGVEVRRRRKDGAAIDISVHAAPVYAADGQAGAIMSLIADVTERKQVERQLVQSERRFRTAFEDAATGMCLTGLDGRFLTVNRSLSEMLGYSREELAALGLPAVTDPEDVERGRMWAEAMLGGDWCPSSLEQRFVHKDGRLVWAQVSRSLLRDEAGAPLYFMSQILDVTEQRSLESQLHHAQKMEALGTLTGGIAHDFNNLLTAITGYASLLEMKLAADDPLAAHVQKILAAAERAAALTRSLLAFSRKRAIEPRPENLNRIVGEMGKLLRWVLREDIELAVAPDEGSLPALVDAGQIEQVLVNLATNARDAMPQGGVLTIGTGLVDLDQEFVATHGYGVPGRYALLTVADTGLGMDEATRQRIFEPFFTTKEVGKGTGLGLAIAYGIVKQHQGYINCYSEPGRGTTFRIYLPLAEAAAEPAAAPAPAPPPGGSETILLAEDSDSVRALSRDLLEKFGYRVVEAADGEAAVERFRERREEIRLAILDVIMPRKNGRQACEEMLALRPDLKVLFTSGYTADIFQRDGGPAAGRPFLSKPILPNELLTTVRRLLDA